MFRPALLTFFFLFSFSLEASSVKVHQKFDTHGLSEQNASGLINGSPEEVWSLLYPADQWKRFMPRVKESFFVRKEAVEAIQEKEGCSLNQIFKTAQNYKIDAFRKEGGNWDMFLFMILDTPFPITNRWFVLRVTHDETDFAKHHYTQCWHMLLGNLNSADGCFKVLPSETPATARLLREEKVDIGGHIPRWVMKLGANITVPQIFKKMEKEIKKKHRR